MLRGGPRSQRISWLADNLVEGISKTSACLLQTSQTKDPKDRTDARRLDLLDFTPIAGSKAYLFWSKRYRIGEMPREENHRLVG